MAEGVYHSKPNGESSQGPLHLTERDVPALVQAVGRSIFVDKVDRQIREEASSLRKRDICLVLVFLDVLLTITLLILNSYGYL